MPQEKPFLSVIVPMKNEQDNVAPLLDELFSVINPLGSHEVLAIDDGSTDGTWTVLEEQKARYGEALRLIKFAENRGQSTAFWAGLQRVRGEVAVMMDADLQNDPNDVPKLLAELEKGADVCLTWRANRQDTRFKKVQSRVGNGFRNWILRSDIKDTGSQLRAFKSTCIEGLPHFNGMHRFMGNLFLMRGYKVVQIPTNHRSRHAGVTKYGLGNRAWRGLCDLLGVRWIGSRLISYTLEHEDA